MLVRLEPGQLYWYRRDLRNTTAMVAVVLHRVIPGWSMHSSIVVVGRPGSPCTWSVARYHLCPMTPEELAQHRLDQTDL